MACVQRHKRRRVFSRYARAGVFLGLVGCVRSLTFTSLVLRHGTDSPFICPFVVVCLQYGEGQKETSISQAEHRSGPGRDTPSASGIISSLSMEVLRSYYRIPGNIDFELPDGPAESTIDKEYGTVYLTREQLAVWFRFSVSSLIP